MQLRDVIKAIDGTLLTPQSNLDRDIPHVASSDLMSDVLAFSAPHALLVTGLVNSHVIHTAELAELAAIVFARGKAPANGLVKLAEEKGLPLISSPCTMFEICGRLFGAGLAACPSRL
jgi:predicted transcriptional regulator